jgi:hypothetical protein
MKYTIHYYIYILKKVGCSRKKEKVTGLIASWQFYARRTGTLSFIVWRKTGKDFNSNRKVVGVNTISVSSKYIYIGSGCGRVV